VRVVGDALEVDLRDGSGAAASPGPVATGTYTYEAHFEDGSTVRGAPFAVKPGSTVTIECSVRFGTSCKVE
jgi:hypothetical protein